MGCMVCSQLIAILLQKAFHRNLEIPTLLQLATNMGCKAKSLVIYIIWFIRLQHSSMSWIMPIFFAIFQVKLISDIKHWCNFYRNMNPLYSKIFRLCSSNRICHVVWMIASNVSEESAALNLYCTGGNNSFLNWFFHLLYVL